MMTVEVVENSPLGKKSAYLQEYNPKLLFPIPRKGKRDEIGVPSHELPFAGIDIWNAYEVSWLTPKGKPQVAVVEFHIPAESKNIIESKSFKLYLNSFNQTRLEDDDQLAAILARDLSRAVEEAVAVKVIPPQAFAEQRIDKLPGENIDNLDIAIDSYETEPTYLQADGEEITETLNSDLLKSNCLVTGQPDWGSVVIRYTGKKLNREGLLKYIVSFRNHNEFHEQCVERIFMDIMRMCEPKELTVYARYTRRGGLDINPFRSNFEVPYKNIRLARQ